MNMYQLKLMSFARLSSTASLSILRNASSAVVHTPCDLQGSRQLSLHLQHRQAMHTTPSRNGFILSNMIPRYDIISTAKEKIMFYIHWKYVYRMKASLLYRHVCDSLDHVGFIKDFRLADTYYSWFLINELHVWMLMVRLTAGGLPGITVRKHLVGAMWQDADARRKKLGNVPTSVVGSQMQTLGHQFNAAVIGYDEGLMGNDQVLAGAIWRRLFQLECNNPEHVEKLVSYIRKNINMLDNIPVDELTKKAKVEFIHHDQC